MFFWVCKVFGVVPNAVVYTIPNNNFENYSQLEYIAITPDGTKAYVTDQENNHVNIIDIATNKVTGFVADPSNTFNQPFGIAISPNGSQAYVGNFSGSTVSIIDVASDTVISTVIDGGSTINTPYAIAFTPDGTKAYVTNKSSFGGVSVVDTASGSVTKTVTDLMSPTLNQSTAVAFAPNGSLAYVANIAGSPNVISIIDVVSDTVVSTVTDAGSTIQTPLGIAFTPRGTKAYVANNAFFQPSVSVVDVGTGTVTGTVTDLNPITLLAPLQIVITKDGTTAYVTNSQGASSGSTVSMINVATDAVTSIVGNSDFSVPTGLAITPNGAAVYVVNQGNSTISIIGAGIASPTNIHGCKTKDTFFTETDFINKITWQAATSGGTPVSYNIYRDSALTQLITAVPSTIFFYYDHNRNPGTTYTYYIAAVDVFGNISTPVSVVVTQPC